jgi:predicted ester cyclase
MKASIEWHHSAIPDAQITIEDQVAEGDKVVSRYTVSGTHQGEIMGAVPTGKLVTHTGHQTERFEDGKIVESWTNWDALGLLEEIGAIPSPEQRHMTNNRETSLIYPFC